MKTPDIRRGLVSSRARQSGDSADIGKVARVRGSMPTQEESGSRRRAEAYSPTSPKKVLLWSILLGTLSAGVIALTLLVWVAPKISRHNEVEASARMSSPADNARIVSKFPSPSNDESTKLVIRALGNRDPAQVDGMMWRAGHSPQEVVDYFEGRGQRDGIIQSYEWLSSLDSGTLLMEGVMVLSESKGKTQQRLALLTPDSRGIWKMDFDAFARTVQPSWTQLLEQGAGQGQVRVIVMRDVYYNGSFADENQWVSYAMTSPDLDETLHGYCRKNSEVADALRSLFSADRTGSRATLEIRRVAGGEARQFEITKVLAKDWLVPVQIAP